MIDTGKATIKTNGDRESNIININIYFDGELLETDMKEIYHTIIKEYETPVNILCTRNKENSYSSKMCFRPHVLCFFFFEDDYLY